MSTRPTSKRTPSITSGRKAVTCRKTRPTRSTSEHNRGVPAPPLRLSRLKGLRARGKALGKSGVFFHMTKKIESKPLSPPTGFVGKVAAKFLDVAGWFFYKFSIPGDQPVFDNAKFPWVAAIEAEFPKIRAELDRVMLRRDELPNFQDISSDVKTIQTDNNWKTF